MLVFGWAKPCKELLELQRMLDTSGTTHARTKPKLCCFRAAGACMPGACGVCLVRVCMSSQSQNMYNHYALFIQALCFMAGANSIFDGDKLLTTKNNERNADLQMFEELGLKSRPAFVPYPAGASSSNGQTLTEATAAQRLAAANQFATAATVGAIQQQAVAST